jgi:hypothetical protein
MLSDTIALAMPPPPSWRNLRRLTARISTTYLTATGHARYAALVSNAESLTSGQRPRQVFLPRPRFTRRREGRRRAYATIVVMGAEPEPIALPGPIRAFLLETIASKMSAGGRDPQPSLENLPASLPAGQVQRLCEHGPFGWLLDARVDRVDERIAVEICEESRMAGMSHYRVWDDGSIERLPAARDGMAFPAGSSTEDEARIRQEYYAHNHAVYDRLAERGFR